MLLVPGARREGGVRSERHGHQSADSGQDPQGLQQNGQQEHRQAGQGDALHTIMSFREASVRARYESGEYV